MHFDDADKEWLRATIAEVVRATIHELLQGTPVGKVAERCYTEHEAAELLRLKWWQLRDERRKGRIKFFPGPRKSARYTATQIREYQERKSKEAA